MLCRYWLRPLGCTFSHLLAENPPRLYFAKHAKWAGRLLSRPSTNVIILVLLFTLIPGFSTFVASVLYLLNSPTTAPLILVKKSTVLSEPSVDKKPLQTEAEIWVSLCRVLEFKIVIHGSTTFLVTEMLFSFLVGEMTQMLFFYFEFTLFYMLLLSALSAFTYIRLWAVILELMWWIYIYSLCGKYKIHRAAVL